ncbi:IS3 family transposase [Bittarella massiliensis (ex Durand et al. 2017)]|uniref:IS3 family transposase n=1 Tax=Bittarella massiliensis (ex Durand et al. 2017) TaxID=1720313 RepID=UPI0034E98970
MRELTWADRIRAVKEYLEGEGSQEEIAKRYEVDRASLREWIARYQVSGDSLMWEQKRTRYTEALRSRVVKEYLEGKGSQRELCKKYGISTRRILQGWLMCYNVQEGTQKGGDKGENRMNKGRKTSLEERIEIVSYCIRNGKNYMKAAEKYKVSYSQVYQWVKKYEEYGANGLLDRRGRRKQFCEMSELEKLQAEVRLKEAEVKRLEMENDLLKKLSALEKGGGCRLSRVRQEKQYLAIQALNREKGYPIAALCRIIGLNRSSYYKWINRDPGAQQEADKQLIHCLQVLHEESRGIYGYRRMQINLQRRFNILCNKKRIRRVMAAIGMKSVIRKKRPRHVRSTPEVTAENILNRQFYANKTNEKWLTDVTELKYGNGEKMYLSAILDLKDKKVHLQNKKTKGPT